MFRGVYRVWYRYAEKSKMAISIPPGTGQIHENDPFWRKRRFCTQKVYARNVIADPTDTK